MKKAIVIGAGKFGTAVALTLAKGGADVIVVEKREELLDQLKDQLARVVVADATNLNAMREIGAGDTEVAVVSIGEDFEACVLTVAVLKELGAREIIARANTEREETILKLVGATRITFIESEMGHRTGESLLSPALSEQLNLPDGYSLLNLEAPERWIDQALKDIDLRSSYNVILLGVKHGTFWAPSKMDLIPDLSYRVQARDVLVVVGQDESLAELMKACRS